eukprot:Em0025g106a
MSGNCSRCGGKHKASDCRCSLWFVTNKVIWLEFVAAMEMQVDTGAVVSLISESAYKRVWLQYGGQYHRFLNLSCRDTDLADMQPPAIFQRTMEGILQDIPHVQVYIDDILVADSSREEHKSHLQQFLFNEQKPVPTMASGRIQRWALTLSAYKYHMEYRAGKDQGNVDALSRIPVGEAPLEVPIQGDTVLMLQMLSDADSMLTASAIRKWINTDPLLSMYRLTPHSTTGQSPAELLLGRKPKSHLDFVFPSLKNQVQQQQERQKDDHDQKASHRTFMVGERVYCLNHRGGSPKWLSGLSYQFSTGACEGVS